MFVACITADRSWWCTQLAHSQCHYRHYRLVAYINQIGVLLPLGLAGYILYITRVVVYI